MIRLPTGQAVDTQRVHIIAELDFVFDEGVSLQIVWKIPQHFYELAPVNLKQGGEIETPDTSLSAQT